MNQDLTKNNSNGVEINYVDSMTPEEREEQRKLQENVVFTGTSLVEMPVEKTVEELLEEYIILENSLKDTSKMQEMIASGYYNERKKQIIQEVKQQASIENTEKLINLGVVSEDYARHFRENLPKGITLKN